MGGLVKRHWLPCVLVVIGLLLGAGRAQESGPAGGVVLTDLAGPIGVATRLHVQAAIEQATAQRADLVLIRLDTPGGLVDATRDVIQSILAAPIPVAVYVAPNGARAASAGTYIVYAAHIAAMAPATHLGAATPIALGGLPELPSPQPAAPGDEGETPPPARDGAAAERKAINDAVAYLQSLAQLRGRNVQWAEQAVRDAATLTAADAVAQGVVDLVAADVDELLDLVDGRVVLLGRGEHTLATAGRTVTVVEPDWRMRLLAALANPNVAIILVVLGFYGILFEFWSPGALIPGVTGAISLLLGLTGLALLPVTLGGVALLLLGMALIAAEALSPGFGLFGIGGIVAATLGAVFLFDAEGAAMGLGVAWPVIVGIVLCSVLALVVVIRLAVRARGRRTATGSEEMVGAAGEVTEWQGGTGTVHTHGELWSARGPDSLAAGQSVRVVAREGLTLLVESASR